MTKPSPSDATDPVLVGTELFGAGVVDLDAVSTLTVTTVTNQASPEAIHTDREGRALQGHDPVAYFTAREPTMGNENINLEWNGATWLFATATNRDLFEGDPLAYAPAFGGHCAVGKVFGADLPGSAKRWRIEDGRLYVNKNLLAASQFRLFARRIRTLANRPGESSQPPRTS